MQVNERRAVRRFQEYPGPCWHTDYAILCPECLEWTEDYGDVDVQIDGKWFYICPACVSGLEDMHNGRD